MTWYKRRKQCFHLSWQRTPNYPSWILAVCKESTAPFHPLVLSGVLIQGYWKPVVLLLLTPLRKGVLITKTRRFPALTHLPLFLLPRCTYLFVLVVLSIYLVLSVLGNFPGISVVLSNHYWYF